MRQGGQLLSSDSSAGPAPEILSAVVGAANGEADPYGNDAWSRKLDAVFSELFEHECRVVAVGSGIAANGLGLSLIAGPMTSILCHEEAHIVTSEAGSVEFFSDGARLVGCRGAAGQVEPAALLDWLEGRDTARAAAVPAAALSLSQATEAGTVYEPGALAELAGIAARHGLRTHLDGARFAHAVAALDCSPADLSWRCGISVLSFGVTKNGGINADALIVFDPALCALLDRRRRRAGQMIAKARFAAAQLIAYAEGNLWLRNARHANRCAALLAEGLAALPGIEILYPQRINLVFLRIAPAAREALTAAGIRFKTAPGRPAGTDVFRLATSFATEPSEIRTILDAVERALRAGGAP